MAGGGRNLQSVMRQSSIMPTSAQTSPKNITAKISKPISNYLKMPYIWQFGAARIAHGENFRALTETEV
jgi:hypothetical protein